MALGDEQETTYTSLSSVFLRQILMAVCLTSVPKLLLLTTMPLTSGIAIDILNNTITIFTHEHHSQGDIYL